MLYNTSVILNLKGEFLMKKILSLALAVIMIAAMAAVIVVPTSAEEPATTYASIYSGEEDYSWYGDYNDKEEMVATDPEKKEYHLSTADQLAGLSFLVGEEFIDFDGITIYLDNDMVWNAGEFSMDLETYAPLYNGKPVTEYTPLQEWVPIGDRPAAYSANGSAVGQFRGAFDGQGHTVSGLYVNDKRINAGFFSNFCGTAIKNLNIVNSYFSGLKVNGAFAGYAINMVHYGENRDIVGATFENLYTNAYVVSTAPDNDTRSGGIFGMYRTFSGEKVKGTGNVRTTGTIAVFKNVWFDGATAATETTYYTGGFIGCPAMDEQALTENNAVDKGGFHKMIIEDCLMTGAMYNCPEPSSVAPESSIRTGLLIGNWYNGTLVVKNVILAPKDTNIREDYVDAKGNKFLDPIKKYDEEVIDPISGNVTLVPKEEKRLGKGIFGRWENKVTGDITFENVYMQPIGMFVGNNWNILNPEDSDAVKKGDVEYTLAGEVVVDDGLALAVGALANNAAFDLTDLKSPKLKGFDTSFTIDPSYVPPVEVIPETDPIETDPIDPVETDPVETEPTGTKPAVTQKADEKGCGGFTAIGAVLALVALTGAAVVIKKK